MQRQRTTLATFEADFLGKPDPSSTFYGCRELAFRRGCAGLIHEICRQANVNSIGGSLFRSMVRAGEITLAEAVRLMWEYADAEAGTDRRHQDDYDLRQLDADMADLGRHAHEETDPDYSKFVELSRVEKALERNLAIRLLRADGEDELADIAEDHPEVIRLLCYGPYPEGLYNLEDFESGSRAQIVVIEPDPKFVEFAGSEPA